MALLKQESQTLTVIVRGEGVYGDTGKPDADVAESPKQQQEQEKEQKTPKTTVTTKRKINSRIALINATHIGSMVIGISKATMNYAIGDIEATTGDKNLSDIMQRNLESVNDVGDLFTSTLMGAWYGSRGGWVGAVIGGAISLTQTATSKVYKYAGRERDYQIRTFKLDNEINYARSRANINWTNGRMR